MGRPSASYKREANDNMKSAMAELERREQEKRDAWAMRKAASTAVQDLKAKVKAQFDALKVGDDLAGFGITGYAVKKNKKSFVTGMGSKYTLKELGGE